MRNCVKCGTAMYQQPTGRWRCSPCGNTYQKSRYEANPELIRERKRNHMASVRLDDVRREQMNASRRSNPKYAERGRIYMRQMIEKHFFAWRVRSHGNGVTAKQLAALWKSQRGICALSGKKLGRDAHLDHIHAVSLGGSHEPSNLRWLDPWVNVARQNLTDEGFKKRCSQVAEWIGRRILEATA